MGTAYRPTPPGRWGTYSRISDDPLDSQRGVTRQQQDTRIAVEARGRQMASEYVENDTSAYRKRRIERTDDHGTKYHVYRTVRPVWQQALADLRAGVIDGLMVWDLDRLARDPRDLEDAIEVVEHYGRRIEGESGSIDLTTDGGRAMARVLMAMNNKSSADTGRRVARAARDAATRGTPAGKRAFGWAEDKLALHPVESRLARTAIDDVIGGGRPLGRIATEWNEAGAFTAHYGKPWQSATLRQYLRNPRLAGFRTYRREILRDDGNPVMGQWTPLVDADTWHRLQAALGSGHSPDSRHRVPHRSARHYLLTGLLRCGICNALMYGNRHTTRDTYYYRCTDVRHGDAKHTLSISGPATDEAVTALTVARLAQAGAVEVRPADFPRRDDLARIERKIKELMGAFNNDELPGSTVFPTVKELEAELAVVRSDFNIWQATRITPRREELAALFAAASETSERRTVMEHIYDAILIRPVNPEVPRGDFDLDRIVPVWKEGL